MTPDEFRRLLFTKSDADLLGPCLRDRIVPYVFDANPSRWDEFRQELGLELGLSEADVAIVGSGRLGFSLKPYANLKKFTDQSDIDVVVVNAERFDHFWLSLLKAAYPRQPTTAQIGGWLQKRRSEVYTGWLTPFDIHLDVSIFGARAKPLVALRLQWFDTLKKASRHATRRHEDIGVRLYRSWEYAEIYHAHSLSALRSTLSQEEPRS